MFFIYVLCCCCFTEYKNKVKEAERKSDFQDEAFFSTLIADLYTKYGNYLFFTLYYSLYGNCLSPTLTMVNSSPLYQLQ